MYRYYIFIWDLLERGKKKDVCVSDDKIKNKSLK